MLRYTLEQRYITMDRGKQNVSNLLGLDWTLKWCSEKMLVFFFNVFIYKTWHIASFSSEFMPYFIHVLAHLSLPSMSISTSFHPLHLFCSHGVTCWPLLAWRFEDCTELQISEDILKLRHLALTTNMPLFLGEGEIEVDIALESYWRSKEIHFIKLLSVSVCFFFCPCLTNTHIHTL